MKRFDWRVLGRFVLVAIALVIILGGVALWFMNRSLDWTTYSTEARVKLQEQELAVEAVIEFRKPRGPFVGMLLNPGLQVEEVVAGGKSLQHHRFASLVLVRSRDLADDELIQMTVKAAGKPINPKAEAQPLVSAYEGNWIITPDALWLPRNGEGDGRLEVEVVVDSSKTVILSGRNLSQGQQDGLQYSKWLVPAKYPVLLAADLEAIGEVSNISVYVDAAQIDETQQLTLTSLLEQSLEFIGSTAVSTTENSLVVWDGPIHGSWGNLDVISSHDATEAVSLMRRLGLSQWSPYFAPGQQRNWMADSLVAYLALLHQEQVGELDSRAVLGQLSNQFYLATEKGFKSKMKDLGNMPEADYEAAGLPRAIFFWRRLHAEMGDQAWEQLLVTIQQGGTISADNLPDLVAAVSDREVGAICEQWLKQSRNPAFSLEANRLIERDGQKILEVVVFQKRPLSRGSIVVRVFGENGEVAEERLHVDVMSAKAQIPVDFTPVAIALDPDNEWPNARGTHRQLTLGAVHAREDVRVVFAEGEDYSEEQRAQARRSAEALVLHLRNKGVSAVGSSDQKTDWNKLKKTNIVFLQPDAQSHSAVPEAEWASAIEEVDQTNAELAAAAFNHPDTAGLGFWVFRGKLPETEADWERVVGVEEQVVAFADDFVPLDTWSDPDAWLAPRILYTTEIRK
ncbi:MAG: hypothetical protein GX060_03185 [Firmicutes bacterium]|nr:hypothetical protein [Bacillota bacterium]